jgi:hypothetical protein
MRAGLMVVAHGMHCRLFCNRLVSIRRASQLCARCELFNIEGHMKDSEGDVTCSHLAKKESHQQMSQGSRCQPSIGHDIHDAVDVLVSATFIKLEVEIIDEAHMHRQPPSLRPGPCCARCAGRLHVVL